MLILTDIIYVAICLLFIQDGIKLLEFDKDKKIMRISIVETSYKFEEAIMNGYSNVIDPESLAKYIKDNFIKIGIIDDTWKFKFKVVPGYWSENDAKEAYERNKDIIIE